MDNDRFKKLIETQREEYQKLLPKNVPVDKFIEVAKGYHTDALSPAKDKSGKFAGASERSIFLALQKAAKDGLYMDGNEACFMVFGTEAQYNPMVNGIIRLMLGSSAVKKINAFVVFSNEKYKIKLVNGDENFEHEPLVFASTKEKGERIGVYATAKLTNGETLFRFLGAEKVNRLKAKAQKKDVWEAEGDEMWIKSALRQLNKFIPKHGDAALIAAQILDDEIAADQEGEEIVITPKDEIPQQKSEPDAPLAKQVAEKIAQQNPLPEYDLVDEVPFDPDTGEVHTEEKEETLEEEADRIARTKGLEVLKAWVFALDPVQKAEAMKWIQQVINKYKSAPAPTAPTEPKAKAPAPAAPAPTKSRLNAIADADEIEEEEPQEGDVF